MIEKSKLSSRFKKEEVKEVPEKFTLIKVEEPLNSDTEEQETVDLKQELLAKIESVPVWFDYSAAEQKELVKSFVSKKIKDETVDKVEAAEKLYKEVCGFGPLEYLLAQENVSAIFVNAVNSVHIEISGKVLNTEMKLSEKELRFLTNNLLNKAGVKSDKSILNFKLGNLFISIIKSDISTNGTNISIRKNISCDYETLLKRGMITEEVFQFIISAINGKKNIIISGDINCGKTILLDVLINSFIKNKRSVLLENSSQVSVVSDTLIKFKVDTDQYLELLSNILKMTPEYIVTDLNKPVVQITDRKGIISTLRASNVEAALSKLIAEFISAEKFTEKYAKVSVLRNYDYIVQISKNEDGTCKVSAIVELTPARTAALSIKKLNLSY